VGETKNFFFTESVNGCPCMEDGREVEIKIMKFPFRKKIPFPSSHFFGSWQVAVVGK